MANKAAMAPGPWVIRHSFHFLVLFLVGLVGIAVFHQTRKSQAFFDEQTTTKNDEHLFANISGMPQTEPVNDHGNDHSRISHKHANSLLADEGASTGNNGNGHDQSDLPAEPTKQQYTNGNGQSDPLKLRMENDSPLVNQGTNGNHGNSQTQPTTSNDKPLQQTDGNNTKNNDFLLQQADGNNHGNSRAQASANHGNSSLINQRTNRNNDSYSQIQPKNHIDPLLRTHRITENQYPQRQPTKNCGNSSLIDLPTKRKDSLRQCDFFSGKWVYDGNYHPLYKDKQCQFMYDDLACEKYGRKDLRYQKWRWQPNGCDIPRFNAKALMQKLRGKRVVFVGDSLNRNQWVSLVCLLTASIPPNPKSMKRGESLYSYRVAEYNVSIDYYWEPMLVESNGDNATHHHPIDRRVRIEAIEKHAVNWVDADILIFNSYLWWRVDGVKIMWGAFDEPNGGFKEVQSLQCFKMALKTLSKWLETHVDRARTRMFWMSVSPTHTLSEEWGKPADQLCANETEPIQQEGFWGSEVDRNMMTAVEAELQTLKTKGVEVQLVNITQLSMPRKEAHPSTYKMYWRPLTKEILADPRNYVDCTHWCLPGLPDTWNEILSANIIYR